MRGGDGREEMGGGWGAESRGVIRVFRPSGKMPDGARWKLALPRNVDIRIVAGGCDTARGAWGAAPENENSASGLSPVRGVVWAGENRSVGQYGAGISPAAGRLGSFRAQIRSDSKNGTIGWPVLEPCPGASQVESIATLGRWLAASTGAPVPMDGSCFLAVTVSPSCSPGWCRTRCSSRRRRRG
jgi:hypothetical protein